MSETADKTDALETIIVRVLERSKRHPVRFKTLRRDIARETDGCSDHGLLDSVTRLVQSGTVLKLGGDEYYLMSNLAHLKQRVCEIVKILHLKFPFEAGIKAGEIKKGFSKNLSQKARRNVDTRLFDMALTAGLVSGEISKSHAGVRLTAFAPRSREDIDGGALEARIMTFLDSGPCRRMSVEEMAVAIAADARQTRSLLSELVRTGRLIRLEENRYLTQTRLDEIKRTLVVAFGENTRLSIQEISLSIGESRTAAIPVMSFLDRVRFTHRIGNYRVLDISCREDAT